MLGLYDILSLSFCLHMDSGCNEPNDMSANLCRLFKHTYINTLFSEFLVSSSLSLYFSHGMIEDIVLLSAMYHMSGLT